MYSAPYTDPALQLNHSCYAQIVPSYSIKSAKAQQQQQSQSSILLVTILTYDTLGAWADIHRAGHQALKKASC